MGMFVCWGFGCAEDPDPEPPPEVAFTVVTGDHALTEAALDAIALAPTWLQPGMRVNLVALDDELQDELAALMTHDAEDRWLDELAFCLAHISPSHLQRDDFYPELLIDNVSTLFAIDEDLAYADIIDVGDPAEGGDYYSTVEYAVSEEGVESTVELDRYYYYWYIVHPVIEDEQPTYIDPDSGDPEDPPTGRFWRDFLYYEADEGYIPLEEYLAGYEVLWGHKLGWYEDNLEDNGALAGMIYYVKDWATWGSEAERPVQPVRIYRKHLGRCGEHQDMTTAASRTALIPARNVSAWGNDHVWNEFWDGEWIQVEPQSGKIAKFDEYYNKRVAVDNDCDGLADEDTWNWDPEADLDGDGVIRDDGDCDDHDYNTYPGAPETADAKDNDCNGTADDGAELADADGDGVTIADGDCNDWNETVAPWEAEDTADGLDNDCDGVADLGLDDSDADEDEYSIAAGDCDDTNNKTYPGATDIADGKDNDCDGIADNGADVADRDGDGITIVDGDCHDNSSSIYPGADEVEEYRALAINAVRGDNLVTSVSENYGPEFDLLVTVTDANGAPVDGASVFIGAERLESSDIWPASWGVTDAAGQLAMTLGGNYLGGDKKFYGRVDSELGSTPMMDNQVTAIVSSPVSFELYEWEVQLDGEVPTVEADTVDNDSDGDLEIQFECLLQGYTGGPNYSTEVVSRQPDTPPVKIFVVDGENLDRFQSGDSFDAALEADGDDTNIALALDTDTATDWYLLLVPVSVSGKLNADVEMSVYQADDLIAEETFAVPVVAGDHVAVGVEFP